MKNAFRVAAHGLCLLLLGAALQGQVPESPNAPAAFPSQPPQPPSPPPAAATASPAATTAEEGAPKPPSRPVLETLAPREGVDALSDGDVRQALDLIRANYLDRSLLSDEALARASLQGVLERLRPGVILAQPGATPEEESPVRSEILDDRIGYIRLGALSRDHLAEFDAALGLFASKKLQGVILDLRATPASSDFELAGEYIKRLTAKGKLLFAVRRPSAKQEQMFTSSQDPAFQGVIVSIVSHATAGAGEVIAAVLRSAQNALVIGSKTAGEAAEFSELPLRGGKVLRVAVAEVTLPQEPPIFPGGLQPDLAVEQPPEKEAEALRAGLEKGVSRLVFETERARLNEAALVAGVNPELDAEEAAQKNGADAAPGLSDPVLQRAVDLITTVEIFRRTEKK